MCEVAESGSMKQTLIQLVALVLLSSCGGQDFCYQKQCPQYKLTATHQEYEERLYVATQWITTKIEGTGNTQVLEAHSRLRDYCQRRSAAGYNIPDNIWPVLITITESHDMSLSWFIPPGTTLPQDNDLSVSLQSKPAGTVYVRVFSGNPSLERGQENANALWEALGHNCTDLPTYAGAGYDLYLSLTHHNEIWIYANDIHCNKAK